MRCPSLAPTMALIVHVMQYTRGLHMLCFTEVQVTKPVNSGTITSPWNCIQTAHSWTHFQASIRQWHRSCRQCSPSCLWVKSQHKRVLQTFTKNRDPEKLQTNIYWRLVCQINSSCMHLPKLSSPGGELCCWIIQCGGGTLAWLSIRPVRGPI